MTIKGKTKALQRVISEYLRDYTERPAHELLRIDYQAQSDIASLLVLQHHLRDIAEEDAGVPIDVYISRLLDQNPDVSGLRDLLSNRTDASRALYSSYVFNLANWACVSIISASYLSAFIITRSLLETLVTVGSRADGTMSEKIAGLTMLAPDEQKVISECWRELCGWVHPYGGWLNRLCPVLVAKGPMHHPSVVRDCIVYLGIATDFAYAVAFDKFAVNPDAIRRVCDEKHVDYRRFLLLKRRLSTLGKSGATG